MVGVISTSTVISSSRALGVPGGGEMCMSARLTTAKEPRDSGCSGSEMVDIRSKCSNVRYSAVVDEAFQA